MFKDFLKNITEGIRVDLTDEFDRNFERKAFFDKKWSKTKIVNNKGSLLLRSGNLRRSISSKVEGGQIKFSSSLPYASIHNEGGEVVVTSQMKKFFWAMYYKNIKVMSFTQKGEARKSKKNERLSAEAIKWKNLALMKVGHIIKVEQRQFIGDHPKVRESIEGVINVNLQEIADKITEKLKQKTK